MPFKSESQHRKFRAMVADGNMKKSTLDKMMDETKAIQGKKNPIKSLPERVKTAKKNSLGRVVHWSCKDPKKKLKTIKIPGAYMSNQKTAHIIFSLGFAKVAGGPGSGVSHENTDTIDFLEESPLITIGKRTAFMQNNSPLIKNTSIPVKLIKYSGQRKYVPMKLMKFIKASRKGETWMWDKPVDVIKDDEGNYHMMDGNHRTIAAIILNKKEIMANVYVVPSYVTKAASKQEEELALENSPQISENGANKLTGLDRQRAMMLGQLPPTMEGKERTDLANPFGDTARPAGF